MIISRDHGGKNQGFEKDDGIISLEEDIKYLDYIHIDPFLSCQDFKKAITDTTYLIDKLYSLNNKIFFEVGTEESIFKYEPENLHLFLSELKINLPKKAFDNIKYAVIQSGTSLDLPKMKNIGNFDITRTLNFLKVTKNFGILSKEHNGDYQIDNNQLKFKISIGIDAFNIAPEFGQLESIEYLNLCLRDEKLFKNLYKLCYNSNRWKKWIFNKKSITKEEIILTCCHYILSDFNFKNLIKKNLPKIDLNIKKKIREKIKKMYD